MTPERPAWSGEPQAWTDEARLVLGQRQVDDRSTEITAIRDLLGMLALDGCIVTMDAMGCQNRIVRTVRDRDVGYVLALKGNQPQLHEAVVEAFAVEQAEAFEGCDHDFHKTVNKNHGRIETHCCWALGTPEYLRYMDPGEIWSDLHSHRRHRARWSRLHASPSSHDDGG